MLQGFASVMQGLQTRPGFSHCKITSAKIGHCFMPEFEKLNCYNLIQFVSKLSCSLQQPSFSPSCAVEASSSIFSVLLLPSQSLWTFCSDAFECSRRKMIKFFFSNKIHFFFTSIQGLGFRVQGLGFRVQGIIFEVQGFMFIAKLEGTRVYGLGFRVEG